MELQLNLTEIASGDDPVGLMARRILLLQRSDAQTATLLDEARAELSNVTDEEQWSPLRNQRNATDPLSDDSLREILLRVGKVALLAMLSDNAERDLS